MTRLGMNVSKRQDPALRCTHHLEELGLSRDTLFMGKLEMQSIDFTFVVVFFVFILCTCIRALPPPPLLPHPQVSGFY